MFEKFTEGAIKVIMLAQEEARAVKRKAVEPEHVLLGLIGEGQGKACKAIRNSGVTLPESRNLLGKITDSKDEYSLLDKLFPIFVSVPFTPDSKQVLEKAWTEASKMKASYVDTEHLLLGLINQENTKTRDIIEGQNVKIEDLRENLNKLLS